MPLLNAFRALVCYNEKAYWKQSPFSFWSDHGSKLVRALITELEGARTPNGLGRNKLAYLNLYRESRLLMLE